MIDPQQEEDLHALKRKLLAETRADLLKRQLSNAENYDKAILSLSTVFLGFSFAFLKDLVSSDQARWLSLLYASWIVLTAAVLTTIISFWVSQRAIDVQLKRAEEYYLRDKQDTLSKSQVAQITDWVNAASGILFVFGISLTTAFVLLNIERSAIMSNETKGNRVQLNEGAPIPNLQVAPIERRGAPIPNLQQAPQGQAPQSQPSAQSTTPAPVTVAPQSGDSKK
ncbi:MAG: hypothetical protein OEU68_14155 [Nitrospira sp.]|nr:hypothetical protein [Nitrospira sp.]MDH4244529.1 hypothetical protein [Nitrospira sp.]MDH4357355.1 hypothetical protein [Nitrospira sp.]MDH5319632.1 hypothetical protein [Nitrospira sp.]